MKKTKLLFYGIIALLFAPFPSFAGENNYTLDKCLEYGLKNSPVLKSSELKVEYADQERKSARGQFFPSLSADGSYSNITSDTASGPSDDDFLDQSNSAYSVRLSQVLYAGCRIYNTYTRAEAQKEMYEAEYQHTRLDVIYKIETAFFELMKSEQDVAAASGTVERVRSSLKAAEAYFKREMAPYVQVLLAKVDLANAEQELSIVKNRVDKRRAELFVLMNMPFDPEVKFSGGLGTYKPGYSSTFAQCWDKASKNRSDLKSLEKQIVMSEKSAAVEAGKYLPIVRLDAGYYDQSRNYDDLGKSYGYLYDRDQENKYWKAGASVSWQLFDGGSAWYERRKHLVEVERIKEQIKDVQNRIKSGITTGLFSISEAGQRIKATEVAVTAAHEYYASEQKRFQAGIATIPSVLDAQARLTRAEGNHNQAMLDYQIARAGINSLTAETGR